MEPLAISLVYYCYTSKMIEIKDSNRIPECIGLLNIFSFWKYQRYLKIYPNPFPLLLHFLI